MTGSVPFQRGNSKWIGRKIQGKEYKVVHSDLDMIVTEGSEKNIWSCREVIWCWLQHLSDVLSKTRLFRSDSSCSGYEEERWITLRYPENYLSVYVEVEDEKNANILFQDESGLHGSKILRTIWSQKVWDQISSQRKTRIAF